MGLPVPRRTALCAVSSESLCHFPRLPVPLCPDLRAISHARSSILCRNARARSQQYLRIKDLYGFPGLSCAGSHGFRGFRAASGAPSPNNVPDCTAPAPLHVPYLTSPILPRFPGLSPPCAGSHACPQPQSPSLCRNARAGIGEFGPLCAISYGPDDSRLICVPRKCCSVTVTSVTGSLALKRCPCGG